MAVLIRQLGKNGPEVPTLGYGLMGLFQPHYGAIPSEDEIFAILDRAHEIGARFWDSADLYGNSEEILGKWFKRTGKRQDIFLATKFGFVKGSQTFEVDSSGEYCKKACDASLKALGIDYIDLYYMHHANPKTPIEDTMRALKQLQGEGKIKHIGLSAISSNTLRRACKIAQVAAVQAEYSPFVLDVEGPASDNFLPTCRELGVAFVAAMPLGRGLVTSTFADGDIGDDMRKKMMPRFQDGNREKNMSIVSKWKDFAERNGCSVTQLALAFMLRQGDDIFPIPGTKKIKYLEENWAALKVSLSDAEFAKIREFAEEAQKNMAGHYMPPQFEGYTFTDTVEEGS